MRSSLPALVLSILLLVASAGGASATVFQGESDELFEPADPQMVIHLGLDESGDVRWTIEHRFVLEPGEEEAFREYAAAVRNGERDVDYSPGVFATFVADSEGVTGRSMSLQNAGWEDVRIDQHPDSDDRSIGTIAYSFTWSDFAAVDDQRIYFGDAFGAPYGTWFGSLGQGQQLVIDPPEDYAFENAPTGTQDGALVWTGPHEFGEGELDIVLVQTGAVFGFNPTIVAGIAAVILVAMVGSYAAARRWPIRVPSRAIAALRRYRPTGEPGDATAEAGETLEFEEADEEIDVELLSDEERVERMLRDNGGRMKQATIVKETGWSNAKVSQLLSRMADEGEIKKLRIGRENLITLPEVDPTEID